MKQSKLVFVWSDDWEGLYVDGKLFDQAHSLSLQTVLKAIGITITQKEADNDWLMDVGHLPDNLEDVKFEKK